MFNGAKQTFGATPAAGGFGFGNNTAAVSPFGAPSAFGKPATPGFGQPQGFGQPAQSAFGAAQPQNNLFGAPANQTPSFGAPAANTATGFGGFGQPQQPQQQQTSLFGAAPQPAQSTSLFGQPSTSAFGAAKPPAFGFGAAQPTPSLFNQASTSTASTGFGGFAPPATSGATGMFGAAQPIQSAFGQPGQNGSAVAKYQEVIGTDTLIKNGQTNNVSTKHHCITAMKEYEAKSLEEIRTEDYMANRKGPQAGAAVPQQQAGGMFGATAAPANTSLFGNNQMGAQNTSIFGQPAQNTMNTFAQPTNTLGSFGTPQTSAFGQPAAQQQQPQQAGGMFGNAFPAPATSTNSSFGFTGAAANTSLFGAKPFGQTTTPAATGTGLFGQPAVSAAPAFGQPQPAATGFGTFGQTSVQQTAPLFGGGITTTAGAFGQPASQAQTGFGGFGNTATSMAGGGGMFGAKPATGAFGAAGKIDRYGRLQLINLFILYFHSNKALLEHQRPLPTPHSALPNPPSRIPCSITRSTNRQPHRTLEASAPNRRLQPWERVSWEATTTPRCLAIRPRNLAVCSEMHRRRPAVECLDRRLAAIRRWAEA